MKRLAIFAMVVFLAGAAMPPSAAAAETDLVLNIGDKFIEGRVNVKPNPENYPLSLGGGVIISEKGPDYWLGNVNFSLQDEVFVPALELGLGLKGVFGTTDFVTGKRDTFALPIEFLAGYDFRKSAINFPVSLFASLAYAPSAISFSDTDNYLEFYTTGSFHINYYAAIYLGYRKLEIDYDASGRKDTLSDDAWLFGVKFSF
jgi:hypothetical protein